MKTPAWMDNETLSTLRVAGFWVVLVTTLVSLTLPLAQAQTADLVDRTLLRVCADPANMPFSNKQGEGFENKLAELFAADLGVSVQYTWFPQSIGFVRRTLKRHECDVIMGFVQGHKLVQNSNHYYRSAYVLLTRTDSSLATVTTLDDPRLKQKSIGIIAGTPPATLMTMYGLMDHAKPYELTIDRRHYAPGEQMSKDILSGALDAGILWGPIGGYYAKHSVIPLNVQLLLSEKSGPQMVYRITLAMRPMEPDWKHELNALIENNKQEIEAILLDYGVPLLDEDDQLILPPPP